MIGSKVSACCWIYICLERITLHTYHLQTRPFVVYVVLVSDEEQSCRTTTTTGQKDLAISSQEASHWILYFFVHKTITDDHILRRIGESVH